MREIKDLEHFVLAPGETLILRLRHEVDAHHMELMRKTIDHMFPGQRVLVLSSDIDVMAGQIEVLGGSALSAEDEARAAADMETQRHVHEWEIDEAYRNGRVLYGKLLDDPNNEGWFSIHRSLYPHPLFDLDKYEYSLTSPTASREVVHSPKR